MRRDIGHFCLSHFSSRPCELPDPSRRGKASLKGDTDLVYVFEGPAARRGMDENVNRQLTDVCAACLRSQGAST